jgi:hypothetical protein
MTISISLNPQTEAKLRQRAGELGKDVAAVASELLEQAVSGSSVEEALAPFRKQVADSGMNDHELDEFLRAEIEANRREKRAKSE